MRRLLLALVVMPMVLAGCTLATTSTPASTDSAAAPGSATPSIEATPAGTAADEYCRSVDEFIAASQKALKNPLKADTKALTEQARELQEQATNLAGELIDNPDGITQVQACTKKLEEFNSGA